MFAFVVGRKDLVVCVPFVIRDDDATGQDALSLEDT